MIKNSNEYNSNAEIIQAIEDAESYDEVTELCEYLCKWYEIDMKNDLGEWKNGDAILSEIKFNANKNNDGNYTYNSFFEVRQKHDVKRYDTLKEVANYYDIEESESIDVIQDELDELETGGIIIKRIFC